MRRCEGRRHIRVSPCFEYIWAGDSRWLLINLLPSLSWFSLFVAGASVEWCPVSTCQPFLPLVPWTPTSLCPHYAAPFETPPLYTLSTTSTRSHIRRGWSCGELGTRLTVWVERWLAGFQSGYIGFDQHTRVVCYIQVCVIWVLALKCREYHPIRLLCLTRVILVVKPATQGTLQTRNPWRGLFVNFLSIFNRFHS